MRGRAYVITSALALVTACFSGGSGGGDSGSAGGGGSQGTAGSGPDSPQADCEFLIELTCERFRICGAELTGEPAPPDFQPRCVEAQRTSLDCSRAVSIDASFDECVDQVSSLACSVLLAMDGTGTVQINLPATCFDVIDTR